MFIADVKKMEAANSSFSFSTEYLSATTREGHFVFENAANGTSYIINKENKLHVKRQGAERSLVAGQALLFDPANRGLPSVQFLPKPPVLEFPVNDNSGFATQQIKLQWKAADNPVLSSYRIEISQTPDFSDEYAVLEAKGTEAVSHVLSAGRHFWRVISILPNGLESLPSSVSYFDIQLNYGIKIEVLGQKEIIDGVLNISGESSIQLAVRSENTSVDRIEYRINNEGAWQDYRSPFNFEKSGTYYISARGKGVDGRPGIEDKLKLKADADPPNLRIHISDPTLMGDRGLCQLVSVFIDDESYIKKFTLKAGEHISNNYPSFTIVEVNNPTELQIVAEDQWGYTVTENWVPREQVVSLKTEKKERRGLLSRIFGAK